MKSLISACGTFIILIFLVSCSTSPPTYDAIAEQWANSLHKYVDNPTSGNHDKLKSICSEYTGSLIKNEKWLETFCFKTNNKGFKYKFVHDSISYDKKRAYVWYSNQNDPRNHKIMKITLRQSLTGWVVDMPLM